MPQHLTDMNITRVSLVDKGANARQIAVLKRDDEAAPDTSPKGLMGLLRKAADALAGKPDDRVAKAAQTFASVMAGRELTDALDEAMWTLEDVIWGAIYAYDANGQGLSLEAKQALVAQSLDEFKAYLLGQMAGSVGKRDETGNADARHVRMVVEKVGKKISGSRLERLQSAAEALTSVLAEVVEAETEDAGDGDPEEEDVSKLDEIMSAVGKLADRLEGMEKAQATGAAAETEEASEATLDDVVEAVSKLADRIEKIEKRSPGRTSLVGQDGEGEVKKSASKFAGIL